MTNELDRLAPREREVLELLLALGDATAVDLQKALDGQVANSTVRKMLERLEAKGLVTFRRDGVRYVYRATVTRKRARRQALDKVIRVFFGGSPGQAALAALSKGDAELSDDELDELEKIIHEARSNR